MRVLITESWLLVSALMIALGLVAGSMVTAALGALILTTGAVARFWARLSLEEVFYTRTLSEHRVFQGERVWVTVTLTNRKRIPLPWIEVREHFPRGMPSEGTRLQIGSAPGSMAMVRTTSLGRGDRVSWSVTLRAARRGYFRVGPARLRSGDLFGFFEREEEVGRPVDAVVVYPQTFTLPDLGLDSARPFGDLRGGRRIFEDPSRIIGIRDYQHGDSLRRIDWKATARVQRLQSRLYEPSRSRSVVVALNIPTLERTWQGADPLLLERGVAVAASLALAAYEEGSAVGLIANGSFPDADRPIRIGPGNHPEQLNHVLEALAMVTSFVTSTMSSELEQQARGLPAGATVVLVAAVMPEDLAASLQRLRGEGHYVHVVKTSSRQWHARLDRIPVSDVAAIMEQHERDAAAAGLSTTGEDVAAEALGMRLPA